MDAGSQTSLSTNFEAPGHEIQRRIGWGAMAEVFLVRRVSDGALLALKVPRKRKRDLRMDIEAALGAALEHPNLVTVRGVLDIEGRPCLLMDFVDGPSLEAWLLDHRPDRDLSIHVAHGVARGVKHIHEAGLIHRDLKPANVMIEDDGSGLLTPRLTDFGMAKGGEMKGHTLIGTAMGTPDYAAPEQLRDASSVDQRADLFSLGCIVYELFAGEPLFDKGGVMDRLRGSGPDVDLEAKVPDMPADVRQAVGALLASKREDRPDSVDPLIAALEANMPWLAEAPAPSANPARLALVLILPLCLLLAGFVITRLLS